MPLQFSNLNSPLVVAVNCDNKKAMGTEKWHRTRLEILTENITQSWEENNGKMEIEFEINKELE